MEMLGPRIVIDDALVVELHPEILTFVNVKTLDATLNAKLRQLTIDISLETFRHRVVDTVVHT